MKKLILLAAAALVFSAVVNAQAEKDSIKKNTVSKKKQESIHNKEVRTDRKELRKLNDEEVSFKAKQNFVSDFDNITEVQWKRTTYFDEATFTKDGKVFTAYYDFDSKLVGKTSNVAFADLPVKAQKEITTKYKEYSNSVVFFDDNQETDSDMMLWGFVFDDADNYFIVVKKDNKKIILRVDTEGDVFYFKDLEE